MPDRLRHSHALTGSCDEKRTPICDFVIDILLALFYCLIRPFVQAFCKAIEAASISPIKEPIAWYCIKDTLGIVSKCNTFKNNLHVPLKDMTNKRLKTQEVRILRMKTISLVWDHAFSTYARFSKKLTFLPLIRTRACSLQGVSNKSFSENFGYVLNG